MAIPTTLLTNLPVQVPSFIGRDVELAEVRALVAGSRLVTLTGAGGAGKTRLGLQVAAGLADGAGDGVVRRSGSAGRPGPGGGDRGRRAGRPSGAGPPSAGHAGGGGGGRSLLVVLDNCEHVVDACAKLADALLRNCRNLALLATSREPLGIGGEQVYRVPSLGTPADGVDPAAIRACEAVRLWKTGPRAGVPLAWDGPTAEVAGRICRRRPREAGPDGRSDTAALNLICPAIGPVRTT